jgi:hypothetical protein
MLEYIEKLREKEVHVRKRYAFVVSFSISALIMAGWLASYGVTSNPVLTEDDTTHVETPTSSLTASVGNIYDDVKGMIFGSNKVEYGTIEVTGGKR